MVKPLIVVDFEPKGMAFLDYFNQQAEVITVQSPPVRCTYTEIEDEGTVPRLSFSFTPLPTHTKFIKAVNQDRDIFLVFDSDIVGDYLGWLIQCYLRNQKGSLEKVQRLRVSCYSKKGIERAIAGADREGLDGKQDFYIRSLFDLGLGAHLQRLIGSRVGPGNRPLTYSSLTTIFLLEDRNRATKSIAGSKSWQIMVELGSAHGNLTARLEKAPGVKKNGLINDVALGKEIVELLKNQKFEISKIEREELLLEAPLPYSLTEILSDAQLLYGFQPGKTVEILKYLSAGVEIQGRYQGLVTSLSASKDDCVELLNSLQKICVKLFGEENKRGKAHDLRAGALLPLVPEIDREILGAALDEVSLKIYELIYGRALASQMKGAVGEKISVQVSANDIELTAQFNSITQQGFLSAHRGCYDAEMFEPCPFVDLQEGEQLQCVSVVPQQAGRPMQEQYTVDTLFGDLADFTVAAEPYNIMMLQGLIDNGYITAESNGTLVAAVNTSRVASLLNRAFPKMSGINLSAYIEQTVNEVLTGRKGLDFALKQFGQTLMLQGKRLVKFKPPAQGGLPKRSSGAIIKHDSNPKVPAGEKPSEKQPRESDQEDGTVLERQAADNEIDESTSPLVGEAPEPEDSAEEIAGQESETGDVLGEDSAGEEQVFPGEEEGQEEGRAESSLEEQPVETEEKPDEQYRVEVREDFPDELLGETPGGSGLVDKNAELMHSEGEAVETDEKKICPVCAKFMILKKDKFGKFWNCSGFPACRHSEAFKLEQGFVKTCPLCRESEIVTKRTPTGKAFHVCLEPDCEFMAWSEPYHLPCQVCGSPYLVEKKSAQGKMHLRCPKAGCNYMQEQPGEDDADLFDDKTQIAEPVRKKVRMVRRSKGGSSGGGTKKVRVVRRRK